MIAQEFACIKCNKDINHNKTERRLNASNDEHEIMPIKCQMIKMSDQRKNNAVLTYY